jgi:multidrug efflux system outer membrane protein
VIHALKNVLTLSLVALLAACGQTQEFVRPAAPVPAQWPVVAQGAGQEDAAKIHWKTYFPDPRLQALIGAALQNNRDMRIAAARVEEARAQYAMVRADRFPAVNLIGGATYTGTPTDLVNAGTPATYERYDMNITTVSYEVDFWGRLSSLSEAARNSFLATQEAQRAFQLSLISDVATSYYTLLQFDELIQLASETLATREVALEVMTKGRDIGGSYDFEVEQASSMLEGSRSTLDSLQHQRATAQNRLNYLVGEVPQTLPQGLTLREQGFDSALAPGLPAEVLLLRPDVMAAEQRLRAAHANIDAARAAFLPKVMLTAGIGVASQGLATLFSGSAWNFAPTLAMPLFDGGKLAASKDLAEVRKVIAVADYEKTIQLAFREVADLLSARDSLKRQVRSAEINEKAQAKRLEIALARNKVGLTAYLEVLDSQRELLSAQQGATQVRRSQLEASAQLYKALGGGA